MFGHGSDIFSESTNTEDQKCDCILLSAFVGQLQNIRICRVWVTSDMLLLQIPGFW